MFRRIFILMLISLLVVGLLASCAPQQAGNPAAEGQYVIGDTGGDWGYPTPFAAYPRGPGYLRMSFIFDTLVWKDKDGFSSALAEDWNFDHEDLSYTFRLHEDVKWHDGTSFSADDVVFTYQYLQEKMFHWADLSGIDRIEKIDENQVKMYLEEPDASFINNIAGVVPLLPRHIWEEVEEPEDFTGSQAVVGTGPFRLEKYKREQGIYRFSAFHDYYLGDPKVENLLFIRVSDPQQALLRGDVNYAQVQPEAVSALEETGFEVVKGTHDWSLKLMFNHRESPLDDVDFRRALAKAINLDELVERALRGHGLPGSPGLISPDSRWFHEELPRHPFDTQEAVEILRDLGYTMGNGDLIGKDGEKVALKLLALSDYAREAEIVGEQLRKLGVEVELRSAEQSLVDSSIRSWDFDLAITGHGGIGGDPEILKRFMTGEASPHLNARSENPDLREKLMEQGRELNPEKRESLVSDIQRIYAQDLPTYTLHYPTWYFVYNGDVEWFFTRDGIASGIPLPLNKMALLQ